MEYILFTISIFLLFSFEYSLRIFFLVPITLFFILIANRKPINALMMIILLLGTPIYINILGKDVTTLTTILIFELFVFGIFKKQISIRSFVIFPFCVLILLYIYSSFSLPSVTLQFKAYRNIFGLSSGILLVFICKWLIQDITSTRKIANALIILLGIQSLVIILQVISPEVGAQINAFLRAREEVVTVAFVDRIFRGRGTLGDYELLAEWLVGVIPLGIYFITTQKKNILAYLIIVCLLVLGLINTVTRGALIALVVSIAIYIAIEFFRNKIAKTEILMPILLVVFLGVGSLLFSSNFNNLLHRFEEINTSTLNNGFGYESFAKLIHRDIWLTVPKNLNFNPLLGNGFLPFYDESFSLHSLPLTVWYETGIVGSIAWLSIFAYLFFVIQKNKPNTNGNFRLLAVLISGFLGMLISEMKVEFLRQESTMQFFLLYYGLIITYPIFRPNIRNDIPELSSKSSM
jgi:hypothetical protein